MKFRLGFVTNSSSSSFLLGFKSIHSVEKILNEAFGYLAPVVTPYVLKDIVSAEKMDVEQAKAYIKEEDSYSLYDMWRNKYADKSLSPHDTWESFETWLESEVGLKEWDKYFEKWFADGFNNHPEYAVFVALEYGNERCADDWSDLEIQLDLENNFMDKLGQNLITVFSHH